jgi:hypothetical protein
MGKCPDSQLTINTLAQHNLKAEMVTFLATKKTTLQLQVIFSWRIGY